MQLPGPLPDPSPQIHQQLLDYPPLTPHSTHCIGIGSRGSAHQVVHMSIDMAVVGPGQGVYMCTCPRFHLLHVPPPHLSIHVCTWSPTCLLTPSFVTSFLHPLPVLPHTSMPVHCHLYSHLLVWVCTFVCACAALVHVCVLVCCCCIGIVSIKHQITIQPTLTWNCDKERTVDSDCHVMLVAQKLNQVMIYDRPKL